MGTLLEYVLQNGGETFVEKAFNQVDNLVLSQLAYVCFDGLVPQITENAEPVTLFEALHGNTDNAIYNAVFNQEMIRQIIPLLCISRRFGRISLNFYTANTDEKTESQFSAVTFFLDDHTAYVAYRGTDNTLVGWKEDFNMAFITPVPSQIQAVDYLCAAAARTQCKLRVGGHSKGGNLAVYACANAPGSVTERICAIYNNDGPGFTESFFQTEGFLKVRDRIHKFLPQSSLIGMLLCCHGPYTVVESSGFWILQHDPLSWHIQEDAFVTLAHIQNDAMLMNRSLNVWINTMSVWQRSIFVDTLFHILGASQVKTFKDMNAQWRKSTFAMISAFKGIDPSVRKLLMQTVASLVALTAKGFKDDRMHKWSEKRKAGAVNRSTVRRAKKEKQKSCKHKLQRQKKL